jgi:hypothetical protein
MKRRYIYLGIVFIAAWLFLQFKQETGSGSTYSYHPGGTKAFFLFLKQNGVDAQSWLYPFSELEPDQTGQTMFIISPKKMFRVQDLRPWVARGNRLVTMGLHSFVWEDLRKRKVKAEAGTEAEVGTGTKKGKDFKELAVSLKQLKIGELERIKINCPFNLKRICSGVDSITQMRVAFGKRAKGEVIASSDKGIYLFRKAVGKGEVWMFSGTAPVQNQFIDSADNLRLLFQLIGESKRVLFDEFHHGHTAPVAGELKARQDAIYVLIGFLLFVFILGAFSRSVRFGDPRAIMNPGSSSTVEFTSVLGLLYREHQVPEVLKHYLKAWRARVEKSFGISARKNDESLVSELLSKNIITSGQVDGIKSSLDRIAQTNFSKESQIQDSLAVLENVFKESARQ